MTRGFSARLRGLAAAIRAEVSADLPVAGDVIKVEAQISITTGSVSGAGHVPSKPGEPPNNDVGTLADGIVVRQPGPLIVEIASTAPYSAALEYGSSKMGARPFMLPAAILSEQDVRLTLNNAARRAVRKHFRG